MLKICTTNKTALYLYQNLKQNIMNTKLNPSDFHKFGFDEKPIFLNKKESSNKVVTYTATYLALNGRNFYTVYRYG